MKLKKIILSVVLTSVLSLSFVGLSASDVFAQDGGRGDCSFDTVDPDCNPPTLQYIEVLFVQLLYVAWGFGGLIWMGYFLMIARLYFGADPGKIEEAKKRFIRWIVGIIIFYFSWVIVGNILSVIVGSGVCYEQFRGTPGLTFFFPEVCTT